MTDYKKNVKKTNAITTKKGALCVDVFCIVGGVVMWAASPPTLPEGFCEFWTGGTRSRIVFSKFSHSGRKLFPATINVHVHVCAYAYFRCVCTCVASLFVCAQARMHGHVPVCMHANMPKPCQITLQYCMEKKHPAGKFQCCNRFLFYRIVCVTDVSVR